MATQKTRPIAFYSAAIGLAAIFILSFFLPFFIAIFLGLGLAAAGIGSSLLKDRPTPSQQPVTPSEKSLETTKKSPEKSRKITDDTIISPLENLSENEQTQWRQHVKPGTTPRINSKTGLSLEGLKVLNFFRNKSEALGNDEGGVRLYEDLYQQFSQGDIKNMESWHGWVQWFFPTENGGVNEKAPSLTADDVRLLRKNYSGLIVPKLHDNFFLFRSFLGLAQNNEKGIFINDETRWQNFKKNGHNNLRVTRAIHSIMLLGDEELKNEAVKLIKFFESNRTLLNRGQKNALDEYWKDVNGVRDRLNPSRGHGGQVRFI